MISRTGNILPDVLRLLLLMTFFFISGCEADTEILLDSDEESHYEGSLIPHLQPGIAMTFDDSYYNEWIEMLPIFEKYNARATFFISLRYPQYDSQCREKILKLYNAGNEIGVHTVTHQHLSDYLRAHSLHDYYKTEIVPEIKFLNSLGINPTSFSYPYGEQNAESNKYLSRYFNKVRCMYGNSDIKKVQKVIGASLIWSSDLRDYKQEMEFALQDSCVWVLVEHRPVHKLNSEDRFTYAMLDSICRFVTENNMRFYRLDEIDKAAIRE